MKYSERVLEAQLMSDEDLVAAAQGCTEMTCLYHGPFNEALRMRRNEGAR